MESLLPYIVTVVTTIASGLLAYFSATKKSKSELASLKESNKHDIEKLMNQHKIDLEALKQKHEYEMDKIKLEHTHKMELKQKEMESMLASEAIKLPEIQSLIAQGAKQGFNKR